jgi:hypothetical protein
MKVKRIEPFQVENFLGKKEIDLIYKNVDLLLEQGVRDSGDKYAKFFKFVNNGFITCYGPWHQYIYNFFKNKGEEFGQNEISPNNMALIFARYSHDSGGAPNLSPHIDVVANKIIYTCTVRLKSTKQWDIYVKDQKFDMPNEGSAIWFTGNQDAHWRPDLEFGPDDYYDIMLVQVWSDIENDEYDPDHKEKAQAQEQEYMTKYSHMLQISNMANRNDNTDCIGVSDGQNTDDAYRAAGYNL